MSTVQLSVIKELVIDAPNQYKLKAVSTDPYATYTHNDTTLPVNMR